MKVKRFFAPDIRQAIRMVRDEHGPDAVILSNRRVEGGVEIVAAADYSEALFDQYHSAPARPQTPTVQSERSALGINKYQQLSAADDQDEDQQSEPAPVPARSTPAPAAAAPSAPLQQTIGAAPGEDPVLMQVHNELKTMRAYLEAQIAEYAWGAFSDRSPVQAEIVRRAVQFGLSHDLARDLAKSVQRETDIESAWSACISLLTARIPVANDDIVADGGVIALVGPTGVGKTTTIAKLAARYAMRQGVRRIALITTDDYRVGAHEQLRTYGRLLDIPVRNASNADELQQQLSDLSDKNLVLIDTAGISQRDIRLSEQLAVLRTTKAKIKVYLVLAANAQSVGMEEAVNAFRKVELDGCIVTKVDEACVMGGVLSAALHGGLPLMYFSDGQRVPEDLHLARADKLVNQGVVLMKQRNKLSEEEMMVAAGGRVVKHAH